MLKTDTKSANLSINMHKSKRVTYILSPGLVEDVRDTRCSDAGSVDGEFAGKTVVVEFHACMTLFISYHIRIPVESAARVDVALDRTVGILRRVEL